MNEQSQERFPMFQTESIYAAQGNLNPNRLLDRLCQLELLTQNVPGGLHCCADDEKLTLLFISDGFLSLFGYTQEEIQDLFDYSFLAMLYPPDRDSLRAQMAAQRQKGNDLELEYRVLHKSGRPIWILDKSRLLDAGEGQHYLSCILVEIDDRKKEQEALRLSLERHQVILDQATDIIFEWSIPQDTLLFSGNWQKKFGYAPITEQITQVMPSSPNIHPEDMPFFLSLMQNAAAGIPYQETEFRIRHGDGHFVWCRIRSTTQFDNDHQPVKAVGVITDISQEKRTQQELLDMAQMDALTGLYNKAAIQVQVEQHCARTGDKKMHTMFIIDVDNFKSVNDTFGHLCGDALLSDVAATLKSHFRSSDYIGRIGGDEFLVFMTNVSGQEAAEQKAKALLEKLHIAPIKGVPPISCSIGAVLSSQGEEDYVTLYRKADQALYHQKAKGKNGVFFYNDIPANEEVLCDLAQSAVGAVIASTKETLVDEQLAQYTFRMLYQSIDIPTAIHRLLEIVGRAYDVSRVYIFENSQDGLYCNNTFEWCAPGIVPQIDQLQHLSYTEDLGGYLDNFGEDGVFYCGDIHTLHPDLYQVLAPQGICSLLQCAILDAGRFAGYVGFDECRENRHWTKEQIASLTLISNVLAVFLVKQRLEQEVQALTGEQLKSPGFFPGAPPPAAVPKGALPHKILSQGEPV